MAQALDQIMSELDQYYKPQADVVNSQLSALPGQSQAQIAGLDQAKANAFNDITAGANSRGVLYSGIPIAEQGKYVGANYLPALANVQKAQTDQTTALQGKLADITAQKAQQAYSIRQQQLDADAKAQQAAAQLAAQQQTAANRVSSGGRSSGGGTTAAPDYNSNSVQAWVNYVKQNYNGKNWGQVAKDIEAQAGKIPTGSNLDQALHYVYTGVY